MPIWQSSELLSGRPGSPARRGSSRATTPLQPSRAQALPPLWGLTDGNNVDDPQHAGNGATGQTQAPGNIYPPNPHPRPQSGCSSLNSFTGLEAAPPAAGPGPGGHGPSSGPPGPSREITRQSSRSESRGNSASSCTSMPGSNTYTVQYIGIANGELGILSQKQKLTIPVTVPGAAGAVGPSPSSNVVMCRRHARVASAAPSGSPGRSAGLATTAGAAVAATAAAAPATAAATPVTQPARPPLPPFRPTSTLSARPPPLAAFIADPNGLGLGLYDTAAAVAAVGGVKETDDRSTDEDSPVGEQLKPPSIASIVDDAHGQVKVINECFFSRALHSRGGPRDRHTRQNRPMGPQVRDMEPLSTALPGCFGSRAPSAGGFPGWKLTAAATATVGSGAPRRTYSGTGSGYFGCGTGLGSGSGSGPGAGPGHTGSVGRRQRAASAQPVVGCGEEIEAAGRPGPVGAAGAAASNQLKAANAGAGRCRRRASSSEVSAAAVAVVTVTADAGAVPGIGGVGDGGGEEKGCASAFDGLGHVYDG